MSYTKGPWTADDTSVKHGRDIIASVFDPDDTCHRTAVGMANAVLISAAPDMYELLKMLDRRGGLGYDVHEYITNVLAKAEGK